MELDVVKILAIAPRKMLVHSSLTRKSKMIRNSLDRSYYFKGMLLLVRKDKKISNEEKELLMRIGKILRFNQRFCEQTISDLLENEHITELPLQFSTKEWAEFFLKDAIKIAYSDHEIHFEEYNWLQQIARANDIRDEWLVDQLSDFLSRHEPDEKVSFEVEKIYMLQPQQD